VEEQETAAESTILLIEDNETDVFVIKEVLRQSGRNFRVEVAPDGPDALAYLRNAEQASRCPALILLDLNLPKMTGMEILKMVRASSICGRIPVIVVSSSGSRADREESSSLGADAYFRKPTGLDQYMKLADVIESLLPRGN
jgi:CheY-like chemotaxis protein